MNELVKKIQETSLRDFYPDLKGKISEILVDSTTSAENAGILKDQITFLIKHGEMVRDIKIRPHKEAIDEIKKDFNPDIDTLKFCKVALVNKIVSYQKAIEAQQRKKEIEEKKIEIKENASLNQLLNQAEKITQARPVINKPVVNIRTRKIKVVQIVDISKIPKKYFTDPRVIDALKSVIGLELRAGKSVPGAVMTEEEINY